MEGGRAMWEELGLPALTPQPPWHGYSLGEWDEAWERYAARAVEGRWQESGGETFARRRGGLTPGTPVREVEGKGGGEAGRGSPRTGRLFLFFRRREERGNLTGHALGRKG